MSWTILLFEAIFCFVIIHKVAYTEIDWIAYMQEVKSPLVDNNFDYPTIRGDTGPLVYPAFFIYIYSVLYKITDAGENIRLAQYIFLGLYLVYMYLLLKIYTKTKAVHPFLFGLLVLSRRIHSIFVLRLFNDCFAITLLYAAILSFLNRKWSLGSLFYSLAVGVKMNIFLFAPALLGIYIEHLGISGTILQLFICGIVQIIPAIPFLLVNWKGYLQKAFEFDRVFFYKWTVNFRFLDENTFIDKRLGLFLLFLMVFTLVSFAYVKKWGRKKVETMPVLAQDRRIINMLFFSNFIGIFFSRTIHYQFYVWYGGQLLYLLSSGMSFSPSKIGHIISGLTLFGIELVYNIYPPAAWASICLWICHSIVFFNFLFGFGILRLKKSKVA